MLGRRNLLVMVCRIKPLPATLWAEERSAAERGRVGWGEDELQGWENQLWDPWRVAGVNQPKTSCFRRGPSRLGAATAFPRVVEGSP